MIVLICCVGAKSDLFPKFARSYLENRLTYIAEICIFISIVNDYKRAKFKTNRRGHFKNGQKCVDLMWNDPILPPSVGFGVSVTGIETRATTMISVSIQHIIQNRKQDSYISTHIICQANVDVF